MLGQSDSYRRKQASTQRAKAKGKATGKAKPKPEGSRPREYDRDESEDHSNEESAAVKVAAKSEAKAKPQEFESEKSDEIEEELPPRMAPAKPKAAAWELESEKSEEEPQPKMRGTKSKPKGTKSKPKGKRPQSESESSEESSDSSQESSKPSKPKSSRSADNPSAKLSKKSSSKAPRRKQEGLASKDGVQQNNVEKNDALEKEEEEEAQTKPQFIQSQADDLKQDQLSKQQERMARRLTARKRNTQRYSQSKQDQGFLGQLFGADQQTSTAPEPHPEVQAEYKPGQLLRDQLAEADQKAVAPDELPIRLGGGSTTVLFWKPSSHAWSGDAVQARNDTQELKLPAASDVAKPKGVSHMPLSGWNPPEREPKPRPRKSKRLTTTEAFSRKSVLGGIRREKAPSEPKPQPPPEPPPEPEQSLFSTLFGQQEDALEVPVEPLPPDPPQLDPVEPLPPDPPQPDPAPQGFFTDLFGQGVEESTVVESSVEPSADPVEPPMEPPARPPEDEPEPRPRRRLRPKERPQPPALWTSPRQPEPENQPEPGNQPEPAHQVTMNALQQRVEKPPMKAPEEWTPDDASEASAEEAQPGKDFVPPPPELWKQSKSAVKELRTVAAEASSPTAAPDTEKGFCFAPAVALRLVPGYQGEIHEWSPPKPEIEYSKARAMRVHGEMRSQQQVQLQRSSAPKGPPSYEQVLAFSQAMTPPKPAVVPLRMDYQNICRSQLGPASLVPGASLSIKQFQDNMLSTGARAYTNMSHGVEIPAQKPEFRDLIEHFDVEFDGAGRPWAEMDRENLVKAFEENKEIRKKLMRDGLSMRPALPKPKPNLAEIVGHKADSAERAEEMERMYGHQTPGERPPRPRAIDSEGHDGWYYKINLDIVIVKAINIPENVGLFQCDPYVQVTVLDGDPFSPEALAGGTEWYRLHEQWHGETPILEGTTEPEWRHRMAAEIRPRENTVLHVKLFDQDLAAIKDRGVGHCTVPIAEIQKDYWHGVRPIALEPFDTKKAKDWAGLVECRLFFSVGWEGSKARVKHKMKGFKQASGRLGGRLARRDGRSGRSTPTAASLADPEEAADWDELANATVSDEQTTKTAEDEETVVPGSDALSAFFFGTPEPEKEEAILVEPSTGQGHDTESRPERSQTVKEKDSSTSEKSPEKEHSKSGKDRRASRREKLSSRREKSPDKAQSSKDKSPSKSSEEKAASKSSAKKPSSKSSAKKPAASSSSSTKKGGR